MRSLHILLIEDDSDSGEAMTLLLRSEGHRVDWASSGTEAMRLYRSARHTPFDVVMLDLMLPDVDGPSLIASLNSIAALPPVIVHTAASAANADAAARSIGATAVLRKPTDWRGMRQVLDQCGSVRVENGGEPPARDQALRGSSK